MLHHKVFNHLLVSSEYCMFSHCCTGNTTNPYNVVFFFFPKQFKSEFLTTLFRDFKAVHSSDCTSMASNGIFTKYCYKMIVQSCKALVDKL